MNAICAGSMGFTSKRDALLRARGMSHGGRRHLSVFRCRHCGRYHLHLSEPEKRSRQARKRRLEELSLMERMEAA